jgi:hypothetical protein
MDRVKKMDCRAKGEVIWKVGKPLQPAFCKMSSPLIRRDRDKKMACPCPITLPKIHRQKVPPMTTKERIDHA